jgi:hypothetical protein
MSSSVKLINPNADVIGQRHALATNIAARWGALRGARLARTRFKDGVEKHPRTAAARRRGARGESD